MHRILALVVVVALSSCAFSAVKPVNADRYANFYKLEKHLNVAPDEALSEVRSALEGTGWEIAGSSVELGNVHTKPMAVPIPADCDCGTWNADPVKGTAQLVFVATVTADGSGSKVKLTNQCSTDFSGQNLYGATTVRQAVNCASRGGRENEFWKALETVVAKRSDKKTN